MINNLNSADYNKLFEDSIKRDLEWHLVEIKELLGPKKNNLSRIDIEMGTQIVNTLTNNFNFMGSDSLIVQFAKTIDAIKIEYPELF